MTRAKGHGCLPPLALKEIPAAAPLPMTVQRPRVGSGRWRKPAGRRRCLTDAMYLEGLDPSGRDRERGHRRSTSAPFPFSARFSQAAINSPAFTELPSQQPAPVPELESEQPSFVSAPSSESMSPPSSSLPSACASVEAPRSSSTLSVPTVPTPAKDAPGASRKGGAVPAISNRHVSTSVISKLPGLDIWHSPETEAVLRGIAIALHTHMRASERRPAQFRPQKYDRFSERLRPLEADTAKEALDATPGVTTVYVFVASLHRRLDIDVSILVMTLIYMERVMDLNAWPLQPDTWRRMLLAGLLAAAKLLYDELVWNVDLTEAFPDWNLVDINELEAFFCEALQYNLHVRSSVFAKYYFSLTSLLHTARARVDAARQHAVQDAVAQSVGSRVELKTLAGYPGAYGSHGASNGGGAAAAMAGRLGGGTPEPGHASSSAAAGGTAAGGAARGHKAAVCAAGQADNTAAVSRLRSFP